MILTMGQKPMWPALLLFLGPGVRIVEVQPGQLSRGQDLVQPPGVITDNTRILLDTKGADFLGRSNDPLETDLDPEHIPLGVDLCDASQKKPIPRTNLQVQRLLLGELSSPGAPGPDGYF